MEPRQNIYEVPDNFADSGRVFKGLFETRAFIEGCVLGLGGLVLALLLPLRSADLRLCAVILCAGPAFALGILGIRGDPVSTALLNVYRYFRTRRVMLFDDSARALEAAPAERMMEERSVTERVRAFAGRRRNERLERRIREESELGGHCDFTSDTDYARDYIDTADFGRPLDGEDYVFADAGPAEDGEIVVDDPVSEDFPFIPCIPVPGKVSSPVRPARPPVIVPGGRNG